MTITGCLLALFASGSTRVCAEKGHRRLVSLSTAAKQLILSEYRRLSDRRNEVDPKIMCQRDGNTTTLTLVSPQAALQYRVQHSKIWSLPEGEVASLELSGSGKILDVSGQWHSVFPLQAIDAPLILIQTARPGSLQFEYRSMVDPRRKSISFSHEVEENVDGVIVNLGRRLARIDHDDIDGSRAARLTPAGRKNVPPLPVTIGRSLFAANYLNRRTGNQTVFYEEGFDQIEKYRVWSYQDPNVLSVLTWGQDGSGVLNNLFDKQVVSYRIPTTGQGTGPYFEGHQGVDRYLIPKNNPHKVSAPFQKILSEDDQRYLVENADGLRWFIWKLGDPKAGMFRFKGDPEDDGDTYRVKIGGRDVVLSKKEPSAWIFGPGIAEAVGN